MSVEGENSWGAMYRDVALWRQVRDRVLNKGTSTRRISRETGISRSTIRKMLTFEKPPGYGPRITQYPKLGPYIPTIQRLLENAVSSPDTPHLTVKEITAHIRQHGFDGSYDAVRRYLRGRAQGDLATWERAYQIPVPRAIDFLRLLTGGSVPVFTSARLRPFVREAACPRKPRLRKIQDLARQTDFDWLRQMQQGKVSDAVIGQEFKNGADLYLALHHLRHRRLTERRRAVVVLASYRGIPMSTTRRFLGVSKQFVRRYRDALRSDGVEAVFAPQRKSSRKIDNEDLRRAVFSLIHEPPSNYGQNRTSWTMSLLSAVLKQKGKPIGPALIRKMLKVEGYKWRKAKSAAQTLEQSRPPSSTS